MSGERRVFAIVPVKAYGRAKSRLGEVLGQGERAAFARSLAEHVLSQLVATPGIAALVVITDDDAVAQHSARFARVVLRDPAPGAGLGLIVDSALQRAAMLGATASLVCMADLPELQTAELRETLRLLDTHDVVVAPDAEARGTNLLAMAPAFAMASNFGREDSFAQHLSAARQLGLRAAIQRSPGVCHDVDHPAELLRLRSAQ